MNLSVLIILIITGLCCVIPGIFIGIKNMGMIVDAISHSILLGIVLGFMISHNLNSPLIIIGAIIIGLITSLLINSISKNKKVNVDGATAIVFPWFFSLAIMIISTLFSNVHLDVDSVLLGEVIYAPLDCYNFLGFEIPTAIISGLIVLIINVLFTLLCLRGLKLYSFDEEYARINEFKPYLISIGLMIITSITSVISFNSVGSILVISLMIGPVISAMIYTNNLKDLIISSIINQIFCVTLGYLISVIFDVSVAGSISVVIGLMLLIVFIFNKKSGLISKYKNTNTKHQEILTDIIKKEIDNNKDINTISKELNISVNIINKVIKK